MSATVMTTSPPVINGKVVLHTNRGEIEIGLFANHAPFQCRLFLDWIESFPKCNDDGNGGNDGNEEKEKCTPCCFQRYTII